MDGGRLWQAGEMVRLISRADSRGWGARSHGEERKKEQTKHEERAIKPGFSLDGAPLRLHRHRRLLKLRGDFRLKHSTDNSGWRMTENLIKVKKKKKNNGQSSTSIQKSKEADCINNGLWKMRNREPQKRFAALEFD